MYVNNSLSPTLFLSLWTKLIDPENALADESNNVDELNDKQIRVTPIIRLLLVNRY